jgi:hypothetical protein
LNEVATKFKNVKLSKSTFITGGCLGIINPIAQWAAKEACRDTSGRDAMAGIPR